MVTKVLHILNALYWLLLGREIIVPTFGSYGDLLMTNGVLKQYSALKNRKLFVICKNDVLLYNLPFIEKHIAHSSAFYFILWMSKWFNNIKIINYGAINTDADQHLMQRIANCLSFKLEPGFKPFYKMDNAADAIPLDFIKSDLPVICIQSEANTTFSQNKNWIPERMDELVATLNHKAITIQIGAKDDRKLATHYHYQGELTIRQSIYLLSKSNLFIGTEGALMHACSAINTKAVIIFGGYIHPHQSGYENIIGLKSDVECAPCLLTTPCPFKMKCMNQITFDTVMDQVNKCLQ